MRCAVPVFTPCLLEHSFTSIFHREKAGRGQRARTSIRVAFNAQYGGRPLKLSATSHQGARVHHRAEVHVGASWPLGCRTNQLQGPGRPSRRCCWHHRIGIFEPFSIVQATQGRPQNVPPRGNSTARRIWSVSSSACALLPRWVLWRSEKARPLAVPLWIT